MSQIFIANPTLHNRVLQIRINEKHVRKLTIRAGGQEFFPDNLEGPTLKSVISQIERAGGVPASDPKAIRNRFSLLYTVSETNKPITESAINTAMKRDETVRQDSAADHLENAARSAFKVAEGVGGTEVSFEMTQVTDNAPVKGGVDTEITVTRKRALRGGRATAKKK